MTTPSPATRDRLADRLLLRGDQGSMMFYLVIAVVGLSLGALMMPMIVTSSRSVRSDDSREQALDAAQAGINVMVGQIRAATTSSAGDSSKLPCSSSATPMTGSVDGDLAYSVTVSYYLTNPVGATSTPVAMTCVAGAGTYLNGSFTPKYARITSTGTVGTASSGSTQGRKLMSTYVFKTTSSNVLGGQIGTATASLNLCMDAGSATPVANTAITVQTCTGASSGQQIFAYRSDLTLQLVSSITTTYPLGLCLDTAAPPTAGKPIYLAACTALGSPAYTQQWSYNDNGAYQASLPTSLTTGTLAVVCMSIASQTASTPVVLATCGGSGTQAWIPSYRVGSGAAGTGAYGTAQQQVNYSEFGRCLDVTNQAVASDHLIDYPCKQNPYPTAVTWNQRFTLPAPASGDSSATGQIYTLPSATKYCLTSPGTSGGYVTVALCSATNTNQTWTIYNGSSALTYSTKYTIVDSGGRCLGLTDPKSGETWSAIDVETCSGATELKWNATPDLTNPVVQDYLETAP